MEELKQIILKSNREFSQELAETRHAIVSHRAETKELLDIWKASKGFILVLTWLGRVAKWAAGFAAAWLALWAIFSGHLPK
jgi:hypothetical protein